jgi:hypothetical protein
MPPVQPYIHIERGTLHDTTGHVFRSTHLIARFVARKFDSIPLLDIAGEAVKKMPWNSGSFFVKLDPQTSAFTQDQLRVHFAQACQKKRPDFVGLIQTANGSFLEFMTDMPSIPLILSQNPYWCFLDENMKPLAIQDMEEPGL